MSGHDCSLCSIHESGCCSAEVKLRAVKEECNPIKQPAADLTCLFESLDELLKLQELDVLVDDVDCLWPLFPVQWRIQGGGGSVVLTQSDHRLWSDLIRLADD